MPMLRLRKAVSYLALSFVYQYIFDSFSLAFHIQRQRHHLVRKEWNPVRLDSKASKNVDTPKRKLDEYDLPWSNTQKWALQDQIGKFTVQVPVNVNGRETIRVFTMWRTLSKEVPELTGYPIPFLIERFDEMSRRNETKTSTSLEALPFLDEFDFENNGGLTGKVYGVPGVADGTPIRTTPVGDIHSTIPKHFVRTEDGSVVYELGIPASETVVGYKMSTNTLSMASRAANSISGSISRTSNPLDSEPILDADIVRLGSLTSILIGGAVAFQTLSHHLTVNVFWV